LSPSDFGCATTNRFGIKFLFGLGFHIHLGSVGHEQHVVREDLLDESHLLLIEILVSAALTLERNGIIGRKRTFVLPQLVLLDALFLLNLLLVEVVCAWAIERAIVRANAVEVTETRRKLLLLLDISFGQCTVVGVVFVRRAPNEGAVNKV